MASIGQALEYLAGNLNNRIARLEFQETSPNFDFLLHVVFSVLASLVLNPATNTNGRARYCSDCRKVGEGAGAGTGVIVYYSNGQWRRITDDAVAAS